MGFAPADNLHSRVVFWLKILLPLAALGLLATLFLFGRMVGPEDAIPYASTDIADRVKQPRVTAPVFAGMTSDGSALTIKAAEARPGVAGTDNAGSARDLMALVELPGGSTATVTSGTGVLDQAAHKATLTEGVKLVSSNGYTVDTSGMVLSLTHTDVTSLGPVKATGPAGRITAQSMHLGQEPSGGYLLDFTGGVTLIYTPNGGL
jgi:lipopolysaccharide export system protein LptC